MGLGTFFAPSACWAQVPRSLLVGCASNVGSVKPLPTDATASYRSDFSGEAKIDEYDTSAGSIVRRPARTREERAQPIKPKNADENSAAGLYSSIAFYTAATQYMMERR